MREFEYYKLFLMRQLLTASAAAAIDAQLYGHSFMAVFTLSRAKGMVIPL